VFRNWTEIFIYYRHLRTLILEVLDCVTNVSAWWLSLLHVLVHMCRYILYMAVLSCISHVAFSLLRSKLITPQKFYFMIILFLFFFL
jgi:hypothetical protein